MDDDHIVVQHCPAGVCSIKKFNVRTEEETLEYSGPGNKLSGGGGSWVAWNPVDGVFRAGSPPDILDANGYILPTSVGPDGVAAVKQTYGATSPWRTYPVGGSASLLTQNDLSDVELLGGGKAVWVENGVPKTKGGVPIPNPITKPFSYLRMVFIPGSSEALDKWWVLYVESNSGRLLLHPVDSTLGYVVAFDQEVYAPAMVQFGPEIIRVAWSITAEEPPADVRLRDINLNMEGRTDLGPFIRALAVDTSGVVTITSAGSFGVSGAAEEVVELPIEIFPAFPAESGYGRLVHPTLGAFDYEVKPDEWVNIDADAIIPPVWASSRTLTSAANVLWMGNLRDVVVEERWKSLGGLAMPITQLRMLLAVWTTPIDPDVGYVFWYPNYITGVSFKVLPVNLTVGGQGITFDDVINYKDEHGNPIGWVTDPVTFQLKLVERLEPVVLLSRR